MLADVSSALLLVGISLLAVWGRHIILYTAAFIALVLYGFNLAQTELMLGLSLVFVGVYMLYKGVLWFVTR